VAFPPAARRSAHELHHRLYRKECKTIQLDLWKRICYELNGNNINPNLSLLVDVIV